MYTYCTLFRNKKLSEKEYRRAEARMNLLEKGKPKAESIEEDEVYAHAEQLMTGSVLPMTFHAVLELGILKIVDEAGPNAKLSAKEIANQLPTKNPDAARMIDRMLRVLASHCVLTCSLDDASQRLYGLTPTAKYFVPNEDGISLAPMVDFLQGDVLMASWSQLKDAVLEGGIPFSMVHGANCFEYSLIDPKFNQIFNTAMTNNTTMVITKILKCYNGFENLKQLVDVGGGHGITLKLIKTKYPSLQGINYDLPHVIKDAAHYHGVEHVGGDMFKSIPKGDAILMKSILHMLSDAYCLKLLKNCYDAIPSGGKVIVVEKGLHEGMPSTSATERSKLQLDLLMMTQQTNGSERTKAEYLALATTSGFSAISIICTACNFWVMEFYK